MLAAVVPPGKVSSETALQGLAIDGNAQRGQLRFPGGYPIHALSAYCHETGLMLAREPIHAPIDIDRGEAELTVAPALIDRLDWHNPVLTGDALFCQRSVCQQVGEAGGDYLVAVKQNQQRLYRELAMLFDPQLTSGPRRLGTGGRRSRWIMVMGGPWNGGSWSPRQI